MDESSDVLGQEGFEVRGGCELPPHAPGVWPRVKGAAADSRLAFVLQIGQHY